MTKRMLICKQWFLLIVVFFVLVYAVFLSLSLEWGAVLWDEAPHLSGGILLSRGDFVGYIQKGSFYPPLLDVLIALFFNFFGLSLFSARFVSVIFGGLSVLCVFVFVCRFYGVKNALLSAVFFAVMPGFVWLCRLALIEAVLIFLFSSSLFLFLFWADTKDDKMLFFSGLAFGLAFLVKYQALVAGVIMLLGLVLFFRERVSARLVKFLLISLGVAVMVLAPLVVLYGSGLFETWSYIVSEGNEERVAYSNRFFLPIFYLVEMTCPYSDIHPISVPIYVFGLLGLVLWVWRRRPQDKFLLVCFFVVYFFFTMIPNKNWRYITMVFPILAISASNCILFIWGKATQKFGKKFGKVVSVFFLFLLVFLLFVSANDAFYWIEKDTVHIPVDEASQYIIGRLRADEEIMVLCPSGLLSLDVVRFYFGVNGFMEEKFWEYPEKPVDVYTPVFNEAELVEYCESLHIGYLMLYEYGDMKFFQSELTSNSVLEIVLNTGSFSVEKEFGSSPHQIFVLRFP